MKETEAWKLNERHYGILQGRAKKDPELFARYGEEQLVAWRREFGASPPPMNSSHPYYQPPPAPCTGEFQGDGFIVFVYAKSQRSRKNLWLTAKLEY